MSDLRMNPVRVAALGLGYWGPNLARAWSGLDETELAWLCDLDAEPLERLGRQFPEARTTLELRRGPGRRDGRGGLDRHQRADACRARAARAGGRQARLRREAAGAHERRRARDGGRGRASAGVLLVVGHLLVHHPAVAKLKELVDTGELGRTHYLYSNRQNLGQVRSDENALWSLGAHDISVMLHLVGELPGRRLRPGPVLHPRGHRGRRLRACCASPAAYRPHAPVVDGPVQDAQDDDRRVGQDGRLRRHESRREGQDLQQGRPHSGNGTAATGSRPPTASTCSCATATPTSRGSPARSRCGSSAATSRAACAAWRTPRSGAADGLAVVEVLEALQRSLDNGGAVQPFDGSLVEA